MGLKEHTNCGECIRELLRESEEINLAALARMTEENERLKRSFAGHLFDGESASFREEIRSQLIIEQGTELTRVTLERDEAVGLLRESAYTCEWANRRDAFLSRIDQPQEKSK